MYISKHVYRNVLDMNTVLLRVDVARNVRNAGLCLVVSFRGAALYCIAQPQDSHFCTFLA